MLMASPPRLAPESLPATLRARGGVRLVVGETPRGPAPLTVAESAGYRVRFPKHPGACEGVLINTGGGMTGGDRMSLDATLLAGAACTLTTQAAEKIYRSDGPDAEVAIRLVLEPGSRLAWLPQEQILFDGARLARTLDVAMAADAVLTLVESVVFGRLAMGETLGEGAFRDRWRLRRDGRLVFAEEVRLEGRLTEALGRPAVGAGARAAATVLHLASGAATLLEPARAALEDASCECGASALDDLLVVRFLSPDPQVLRADLARFLETLRGAPLPRSWQC